MPSRSQTSFLFPGLVGIVVGFVVAFAVLYEQPGGLPSGAGAPVASAARTGTAAAGPGLLSHSVTIARSAPRARPASMSEVATGELQFGYPDRGPGTGVLRGIVVDELGRPLPGVFVVAEPTGDGLRGNEDAGGTPEGSALGAEVRIAGRAERFAALTEEDGRFEITGTLDREYAVLARLEGWLFDYQPARTLLPGGSVTIAGRPVEHVRVDVLLPDGTRPDRAAVEVDRSGDRRSGRRFLWSPEEPILRLDGIRGSVRALADLVDPALEGSPARLRSDWLPLTTSDRPIVLRLEPSPGLWGMLRFVGSGSNSSYLIRAVPSQRSEDLEDAAFEDVGPDRTCSVPSPGGGPYHLPDLPRGSYVLCVLGNGALLATERVDVGPELTRHDVEIGAPDPADSLHVTCQDADGTRLRGIVFTVVQENGQRFRSRTPAVREDADGSYWLATGSFVEGEDFDALASDTTVRLAAWHPHYGKLVVPLRSAQREARIVFEDPARLVVTVHGDLVLADDQHAEVELRDPAFDRMRDPRRSSEPVGPDGRAIFDRVPPGSYRVALRSQSGARWNRRSNVLAEADVRLRAGGVQEVSIVVPPMYPLVVTTTGFPEGADLLIWPKGGDQTKTKIEAKIDADGVARFERLVAGEYQLTGTGASTSIDVTIPCGSVEFACVRVDCMRVAISDENGRLYQGGLRSGDTIVAIAGQELDADNLWQVFWRRIAEPGSTLAVLRDGKRLEFDPPDDEPWQARTRADNGGVFEAATR
jgi:hypothetical protein